MESQKNNSSLSRLKKQQYSYDTQNPRYELGEKMLADYYLQSLGIKYFRELTKLNDGFDFEDVIGEGRLSFNSKVATRTESGWLFADNSIIKIDDEGNPVCQPDSLVSTITKLMSDIEIIVRKNKQHVMPERHTGLQLRDEIINFDSNIDEYVNDCRKLVELADSLFILVEIYNERR